MFHLLASALPARGWKGGGSLVSSFVLHAATAAALVWARSRSARRWWRTRKW
jgi:hypothetical protein